MPHFKCVTCSTRLSAAGVPADVCDGCGSPFQPVTELAEIVGYRAITIGELWIDEKAVAVALPRPEAAR